MAYNNKNVLSLSSETLGRSPCSITSFYHPRHSLTCNCMTPVSASVLTCPTGYLCLAQISLYSKGHQSYWTKDPPYAFILTQLHLQRSYFQQGCIHRYQRLGLQHISLGDTIQPITEDYNFSVLIYCTTS